MGLIERLRTGDQDAKIAAKTLGKMSGYVRHAPRCAASMFTDKSPCTCGLSALLKELTDG